MLNENITVKANATTAAIYSAQPKGIYKDKEPLKTTNLKHSDYC